MKKYFMKKKLVFFAASRAAGKGSPAGGSATWRVFFLLILLLCLPLSAAADDEEGSMPPTDGDRILLGSIGEASNLIPYLTADSASHEVADLLYGLLYTSSVGFLAVPYAERQVQVQLLSGRGGHL